MQLSAGSETIFFKCYANLKCCGVKQLFNVSEGESSLNCVVTSLHPAAAVSVVKIYLPPLCTDVRDNNSIQQCLCSREQPLHWMCPQLPPFLLGSKFPKRCEWGERDRSLKPGCVCGKFSCQKRRMGVLGWAAPSGMVGDPGSVPIPAGKQRDGRAGLKGRGGSKGVSFSSRGYFVALLMEAQTAVL